MACDGIGAKTGTNSHKRAGFVRACHQSAPCASAIGGDGASGNALMDGSSCVSRDGPRYQATPFLPKVAAQPHYGLAIVYPHFGENDHAFKQLEQCYRDRAFEMLVLKSDRDLDPLRSDPRFQDLVRRVGLPR